MILNLPKNRAWLAATALLLLIAAAILFTPDHHAVAAADFRIIDVRAEYGHLIVEVQHFNPDGSHWFYENYTWRGEQQYHRPRVVDQLGRIPPFTRMFLASDGREAPTKADRNGNLFHYLPVDEDWLFQRRPHLDDNSILDVVQQIHGQRSITGWAKGQQRLSTHPLDATDEDRAGAPFLTSRFAGLKETAYHITDSGTLTALGPRAPPIDPHVSSAWGTVTTFHPDSNPESTSVDGGVTEDTDAAFSTLRADAGDAADSSGVENQVGIASATCANWDLFNRGIILFDTSALPDADIIDSATLDFVSTTAKIDDFSEKLSIVNSTPATNTNLVPGDYAQLGTTKQASDQALSSITTDNSTFTVTALSTTGKASITKTGVTKFGLRITGDNDNVEPSCTSNDTSRIKFASADENISGDKRPRLVVTHSTPAAALTGTIGDGATEQDVRNGAGTIIITLTDATWVAAGSAFNLQRSAIINGLDAAESETNGWNAQVRDVIRVSSVVRNSSTAVTITLVASDVAAYRITSNEVITVTVPSAAISSAGNLTATPTVTITAAAESMAVTGTLGGSGGTAAEIRAGGETIILTLTNTAWVASGAAFNAIRQAIIDSLDSDSNDQNGWDARRPDFAVGNVVRTDGTIVTITLSASSAYVIPVTEIITATAPASAMVFADSLTGAQTFNVVPSFLSSGNRVTAAIDLSSATDVAFCAIGWEATLPASTTLTVETSINGGSTYSSATNGTCPTGIALGSSLSTITDFRIRIALASTDSTVTPLVTALALVIQDASGQDLYYQLNTTPGETVADRSVNTNTGTLSYPVSRAGINNSIAPIKTTRVGVTAEQALTVADVASPVTGSAVSGNLFEQDEDGFAGLPFQELIEAMASGAQSPIRFYWAIFMGFLALVLMFLAYHLTGGSLLFGGLAGGAGMGFAIAIGDGLIPGWSVFLFAALAGALLLIRAKGGLPT
jgi:hypothetical protein